MSRILVTGATGFIGRATVKYLAGQGHTVVAALRQQGPLPDGASASVITGPFETSNLDKVLEGIEAVIHLAARVHQMHDTSADPLVSFRAVNRDATMRLAEAAAAWGIVRFVFLSSVKAVLDKTGPTPVDESMAATPATPYGRSKLEAEQGLLRLAETSSLQPVILRPPLIYGPGVKGNFLALAKLAHAGLPLPLASIDNRRSFIGVGNMVAAIEAALVIENPPRQSFFVAEPEAISTPELLRRLAAAMGRPSRLFAVPPTLMRMAAGWLGQGEKIDRLTDSLVVDASAFMAATGWSPQISMQTELERLARSLYPV